MLPPLSMMLFTVLAGAAQGLLLALVGLDAWAALRQQLLPEPVVLGGAGLVLVMCAAGLVAAVFHLGHPLRAWRAVAMWRTSWLSREVIALPLFMAAVAAWALAHRAGWPSAGPGVVAAVLALVLYGCTGMIYAAVQAMRAWAHPVTPLNFALMGIASGLTLAAAALALLGQPQALALAAGASAATVLAAAGRGWALRRILHLPARTTLQTAIGVRHPRIVQTASGAMGGTFNTREFDPPRPDGQLARMRWVAAAAGFVLPAVLLASAQAAWVLVLACVVQLAGLMAERWCFFAEAQHTQNLYYRPKR